MSIKKRFLAIALSCAFALSALAAWTPMQAQASSTSIEGDTQQNQIVMEQTDKKTTNMVANHNVKYFRIKVESTGKLKLTLDSKKLKGATMDLCYDDLLMVKDTKSITYNKKKKVTKGTLTSSWILVKGAYTVVVTVPKTTSVDREFTLSCKHVPYNYDDVEPNNSEDTAQPMAVKMKAVSYTCFVSDTSYATDNLDNFKFKVSHANSNKTFQLSAKANSDAKLRILIKKKTENGYETVNSREADQSFVVNGKKSTFHFSRKLYAGEYVVTVWLQDGQKKQTEYTISAKYKD